MNAPDYHLPLIRRIDLKTADPAPVLDFYTLSLGLSVMHRGDGQVWLGDKNGEDPFLVLMQDSAARPRPKGSTGLYHFALLYPDHAALARTVRALLENKAPVFGYVDHGASEAVYIIDPDGNGIELAVDKPAGHWPYINGKLAMYTEKLNLEDLFSAAAEKDESILPQAPIIIGHLHLQVMDLDTAARFYTHQLGLIITQDTFPGALFLARGDYHHHIGINTWAGPQATHPGPDSTGLVAYAVTRPPNTDRSGSVKDPNGLTMTFV